MMIYVNWLQDSGCRKINFNLIQKLSCHKFHTQGANGTLNLIPASTFTASVLQK